MAYVAPTKRISNPQLLSVFIDSPIYDEYIAFLEKLADSVKGIDNMGEYETFELIAPIIQGFTDLEKLLDEIPPQTQDLRYGNRAYQTWFDQMVEKSVSVHESILPENLHPAIVELKQYWTESFGNRTRIDYGTGHETNFAAWLFCLSKLGLIKEENFKAVVLGIFLPYLSLMRKIQLRYKLEPAGSHGVWCLDDYHFLPFFFGASQLRGHPHIKPKSIRNADIYNTFGNKFMYLGMIKFINEVKTGPFYEHSQILDSIAGTIHWDKITLGMMKMYKGEVLGKFPVMQHFFFGSILPFPSADDTPVPVQEQ
eukprot:TRINITY_DN5564_c0_g1_i1.p1 TRINITY_DN5564_c0_g1~~TRINITY_DN5564_c0_g1_i1.p1  ORF type:complete len:331 (+),score=76.56 TRINITY_DN5564_c0_g1_i1:61-993(+)